MKDKVLWEKRGEWAGAKLERRPDGLWRYEIWSAIQGTVSDRVVVLREPIGLNIQDEADLDTIINPSGYTKAAYLQEFGYEVRCLRSGYIVR